MPRPRDPSPAPAPPPRKAGRPPTDASGPQRKRSVYLTDRERDKIVAEYGTLIGGIRAMYREKFPRETPTNPSES